MNAVVTVLPVGQAVDLNGDIDGVITAVTIRMASPGLHVCYEVEWWNGRDRRVEWFQESQVQPKENRRSQRIGFRGGHE